MGRQVNMVRLGDIAHARSGDKGDMLNLGVVADSPALYDWIDEHLTEERMAEFLRPLKGGVVRRFELPKVWALNFTIEHALAGGASRSLALDTQGKALGTAVLELRLPAPPQNVAVASREKE